MKSSAKIFSPVSSVLIALALILSVSAQKTQNTTENREQLEKKRQDLLQKISNTKGLIKQTEKEKEISLNDLAAIKNRIHLQEQLIVTIILETRALAKEISETDQIISALQKDVAYLKNQYAKQVFLTYKYQDDLSMLMLLFSSDNFNQAAKRAKYLSQMSNYRKLQIDAIKKTQDALNEKVAELEVKRGEKEALLAGEVKEKKELGDAQAEKDKIVKSLSRRQNDLKKELAAYEKSRKDLDKLIADLLKKESVKDKALKETKEYKLESQNFSANKGKLPWPVAKGVITSFFGRQQHEELKFVEIENNGIDIATEDNSPVRTVFAGEVSLVGSVPGLHNVVIIRHGEFRTVYANLKEIFVATGDKVTTKQTIGTAAENKKGKDTMVHFELWQGTIKQDPAQWLAE